MNFDLENVAPFLSQLESQLGLGLPVADLVTFTEAIPVEAERTVGVSVKFRGVNAQLEYRVFMDDVDAPDLYFTTPSEELAKAIDDQLKSFAEEQGL